MSIDRPEERAGVKFTPRPDGSLIVTTEELKDARQRPDALVWDVRSRGEYTGRTLGTTVARATCREPPTWSGWT